MNPRSGAGITWKHFIRIFVIHVREFWKCLDPNLFTVVWQSDWRTVRKAPQTGQGLAGALGPFEHHRINDSTRYKLCNQTVMGQPTTTCLNLNRKRQQNLVNAFPLALTRLSLVCTTCKLNYHLVLKKLLKQLSLMLSLKHVGKWDPTKEVLPKSYVRGQHRDVKVMSVSRSISVWNLRLRCARRHHAGKKRTNCSLL